MRPFGKHHFFVLVVLSQGSLCQDTVRVLQSTLKLSQDGQAISGAKLVDDRSVEVTDLTLCIRFNYKLLGW